MADPKAICKIRSNDPAEAAEVDMTANKITKMKTTFSLVMTLTTRDPERTKTAKTAKTRIEAVGVKEAAGAEEAEAAVVAAEFKTGRARDPSFNTTHLKSKISPKMKKRCSLARIRWFSFRPSRNTSKKTSKTCQ